jgi:cytochrome P450
MTQILFSADNVEVAVLDPFVLTTRGIDEPNPIHDVLRTAGPLVRVAAPAGGPAWVVTDYALAREVFAHPGIAKDPAYAPESWDPRVAGLEQTAAEQRSLTTLDGPEHARLRQAHTPLFTARRMQEHAGRIREIARDLLAAAGTTDLMADFTIRYPLAVLCDLLGVPMDRVDDAIVACRRMFSDNPAEVGMAMGGFAQLAVAALTAGDGIAAELRDRVPDGTSEADLQYLIFTLIFAGQLTTDTALGFLVAHELGGELRGRPTDELVREVLRRHPSAPYSLWRFTTTEIELAGERLPARAPVLVDIIGINAQPGPDLTFGAGPHFCTGAQLAHLELCAVVDVLRADYPDAVLAVPFTDLRQSDLGGIQASRMIALPVTLGATS